MEVGERTNILFLLIKRIIYSHKKTKIKKKSIN